MTNHRDLNSIAEKLKQHMTEDAACALAAKCLHKNVEIGIVIENTLECAFFATNGLPQFEKRPANNPDVVFHLSAHAVDILTNHKGRNIGELGVEVLKLIVGKEIHLKVPGHLFSILKNGYLNIIKEAGAPFAKFLAENGVSHISKIPDLIKRLKSR